MKKKHTTLIRKSIESGGYIIYNEGNCEHLYVLSRFLYDDVATPFSYDFIASWLKGELKVEGVTGNIYTLDGENNDVIIRKEYTDPEEEEKYKHLYFKTSKKHLLKIIEDWLITYVREPRPQKMLITQEDDGSITFTAFDTQGNEIIVKKELTTKEKIISFFNKIKKKLINRKKNKKE